jgi:hypothetical protein
MCVTSVLQGEGVEFLFVDTEADDFCPSGFEAVESHMQWIAEAWGVEPSPIRYALFEAREEPCWYCPPGAVSCAREGSVATVRVPDRHELAHAAHGTNCSSLLEEGWATLYGDPFENPPVVGTLREAMEGVEQGGRLRGEHYPLAARFMAFLLETHGIETVRELCAIPLPNANELDAALLEVLGGSLDEVQVELDEYPMSWTGQLRQDQACENPNLQPSVGSLTLELGCMAEGVEGKFDGRLINQGLFEVPELGHYIFRVGASEELEMLWLEFRSCARDGMASIYYDLVHIHPKPGDPVGLLRPDVPPGVYVVRAMVKDSQGTSPDLTIEMNIETWPP